MGISELLSRQEASGPFSCWLLTNLPGVNEDLKPKLINAGTAGHNGSDAAPQGLGSQASWAGRDPARTSSPVQSPTGHRTFLLLSSLSFPCCSCPQRPRRKACPHPLCDHSKAGIKSSLGLLFSTLFQPQVPHHLCPSPLDSIQCVHLLLEVWGPELAPGPGESLPWICKGHFCRRLLPSFAIKAPG